MLSNISPKVKICGITTNEDINIINKYKPEYAGFVFYAKSKRNLTYEKATNLLEQLSEDIIPVAVVVSPTIEMINDLSKLGFKLLQVHGSLEDNIVDKWPGDIWQAVNIATGDIPTVMHHSKIKGYVVDGANYGGGETFDWNKSHILESFNSLKQNDELRILAGGLNIDNLKIGIERFNPEVVDVSSGVEGIVGKDEEKIKNFIAIARY